MDPVHERACTRIFSLLNGFLSARVLVTLIAFAPDTACKNIVLLQMGNCKAHSHNRKKTNVSRGIRPQTLQNREL